MKAAVATDKGLEVRDIPKPHPKPNEILVKVHAAGLNRADLNAARGAHLHQDLVGLGLRLRNVPDLEPLVGRNRRFHVNLPGLIELPGPAGPGAVL